MSARAEVEGVARGAEVGWLGRAELAAKGVSFTLVAAGRFTYGLFCCVQARYRRV